VSWETYNVGRLFSGKKGQRGAIRKGSQSQVNLKESGKLKGGWRRLGVGCWGVGFGGGGGGWGGGGGGVVWGCFFGFLWLGGLGKAYLRSAVSLQRAGGTYRGVNRAARGAKKRAGNHGSRRRVSRYLKAIIVGPNRKHSRSENG